MEECRGSPALVLDFRNPSVLAKRRIESSLLSLVMMARPFSGIGRTFLAGLEGKGVLGQASVPPRSKSSSYSSRIQGAFRLPEYHIR